MLAIRMQRTGRKGHAMFRVIVQESRLTPTSGKVVAQLGHYDPHSKSLTVDKEKTAFYLSHGAQPSDRAARLLKSEGVELPKWVKQSADKQRIVKNADKRRSTRPDEPVAEEAPATETPAEPAESAESTEAPEAEAPSEEASAEAEAAPEEKPAETEEPVAEETPAEETPSETEEPAADEVPAEESEPEKPA